MLKFNLLPPEGKKGLAAEELNLSINRFLRSIFIVLIAFIVLVFTIYLFLNTLIESQEVVIEQRKESILFKEFQSLDQRITKINSKIDKVYNVQENFIYFSQLTEEITKIVSSIKGIHLNSIEIKPEIELITIEQPPSPTEEETPEETQQQEQAPEQTEEQTEEQVPQVIEKEYLKGTITGLASKREQVLKMEQFLKTSPYFEDVVSPFQNIISPIDINFIFDFKVKQ